MHSPSTPPAHVGLATVRSDVPFIARIADYVVMALAVVLSAGSMALLAWGQRPILFPFQWPTAAAVTWNGVLSLLFFAQHSLMVRRPFRARVSKVIPPRYDGAFYAISSGVALTIVVALWQPQGAPLFVLEGAARVAVDALALGGLAALLWSVLVLDTFDPCGLQPIRSHLRGDAAAPDFQRAKSLTVRGPYRWVRHPLYSSIVVLFWAQPEVTPGRIVLATLWTAWIYLGAVLEERDLVAEFGEQYRRYQARVPILLPWRGRVR